jgi:hypothetical protein
MQEDASGVDALVFVHRGSAVISASAELCQATLEVTSSLMYPYIPPVFRVVEATCKAHGSTVPVSAAVLACIEADVNVNVPRDSPEDPIKPQLHALVAMLGDAAANLRSS